MFIPARNSAGRPGFRRIFSLAIGCAALFLLAVVHAFGAKQTGPSFVITEKDNNKTVRIIVGDTFDLQLPAVMGTGFSWQVKQQNSKAVSLLGEPELKSPPDAPPNTPEVQIFHFKARKPGSVTLQLDYARPWEKDKPPDKIFKVTVVVQDGEK